MKILSPSYHIGDLTSLTTNCQVKPKIIDISECRLKNLDVLSNINTEGLPLNTQLQNLQKGEP